ncbi:MAG: zinc-ribbon domain-containing protein [Collinsella stercoris]|nr:zinc-ribbon domain-containing protein [Collinsella stercoris]
MHCTHCGAKVSPREKFCTACGRPIAKSAPKADTSLAPSAPVPAPTAAVAGARQDAASTAAVTKELQAHCTSCGAALEPGVRFCTSCGTPVPGEKLADAMVVLEAPAATAPAPAAPAKTVAIPAAAPAPSAAPDPTPAENSAPASASTPTPAPVPAPAPTPSPARPKKRRRVPVALIAAGALIVLAAGGGAALWFTGGLDSLGQALGSAVQGKTATAYYLSTEPVPVEASTMLRPQDAQGQPLDSYEVRVKRARDEDGAALDVATMPVWTVSGADGFSLENLGVEQNGTYDLGITAGDGATYDLPPVTLGADETVEESSIQIMVPEGADKDALARRGMYKSYLDTLQSLQDQYGKPSLSVCKLQEEKYLAWVAGVSYAGLVDFGDGAERLVVLYCTSKNWAITDVVDLSGEPAMDGIGPVASDYRLEVWEYDQAEDKAVRVYQGQPMADASDTAVADVAFATDSADDSPLMLVASTGVNGSAAQGYFGLLEKGGVGVLSVGAVDTAQVVKAERYATSSLGITQDAALSYAGSDERSCEETAQTVKDLEARLRTITGA